jgi:hypothetical protein
MVMSNASSAPGLTMSSQKVGPATPLASFTRVICTVLVDAVNAWMFDVPAIETRPVAIFKGADAGCARTAPAAAKQTPIATPQPRTVRAECRSDISIPHMSCSKRGRSIRTGAGQRTCRASSRRYVREFVVSGWESPDRARIFPQAWEIFPALLAEDVRIPDCACL